MAELSIEQLPDSTRRILITCRTLQWSVYSTLALLLLLLRNLPNPYLPPKDSSQTMYVQAQAPK
jgi:hypothetical protein